MTSSRLSELAEVISRGTKQLEAYHEERDFPIPSFEFDGPVDTVLQDPAMEAVRLAVLEASVELKDLLEGPTMQLRPVLNATSLHAVYKFDVASKVPMSGDIAYEELSQRCGLDADLVRRFVRFAIAHHRVFQEKREGYVSHSAASKLLADSPDAMAGLGVMFASAYPGFACTVQALEEYDQQSPTQCGWAKAHQSEVPIWAASAKDPKASDRGVRAMRQFTRGFGHDTTSLVRGFDWTSASAATSHATVVDVGGGNGHASVLLARQFPNIFFEVQDLPHVINTAIDHIPTDLKDRIKLKVHDFTQPQTTQANIYLFRQIFHDWPKATCVNILKALVPALKPGTCILINDFVSDAPGVASPHVERHIRAMDMLLLTLTGSKERDRRDWEAIFAEADARFTNINFRQPKTCCMSIIQAEWG